MPTADLLGIAEARYLDARDLVDQLELGEARGLVPPDLAARTATAIDAATRHWAGLPTSRRTRRIAAHWP